jgi:hypothetical protein
VSGTRAFVIRRFGLGPLAQWGFIAGALVACLPAFVCSWFFFTLVQVLRGLLASWRDVGFDVLGQRISFNLVELLKLQDALQALTNIAAFGVLGIVLLALFMAAALGVFGAIVMALLGAFYNATGRLRIELEPVEKNVQAN